MRKSCVCVLTVLLAGVAFAQTARLTHEELQWEGFGNRIIEFSGYQWRAKEGGRYGPGNNFFSESEENIRVDENGWLHLRITHRDGEWQCPEVVLLDPLGYGDYVFQTVGRVDQLDPNVILGFFTWEYQETYASNDVFNGANEFDIEFGTWKDPNRKPAQFACQPWHKPGSENRFDIALEGADAKSSHAFLWHPSGLACRSWRGHDDQPAPAEMFHTWFYGGEDNPRDEAPRVHINFWCIEEPPSDLQEHEVILAEFKFIPCSPRQAPPPHVPWWHFWKR